ncbi:MAG: flagellin [Syntrophomonadaceae bacterium]
MRINHNIAALNTYRQLSANQSLSSKSLEKLSSGLRINRAGDDAAGLAISEKMRGQIRGLQQATRNAQDGISMIQTAEGSLNEVHSILQRMRELAVQAANDTNTADDRDEIQKEINQLTSEINRIANTTEFNTQKLLDGSLGSLTQAAGVTVETTQSAADATQAVYTVEVTVVAAAGNTFEFDEVTLTAGTDFVAETSEEAQAAAIVNAINAHSTLSQNWAAENKGNGSFTITAKVGEAKDGAAGNEADPVFSGGTFAGNTDSTPGADAVAAVNTITLTAESLVEGLKITIGNKTVGLWDSTAGNYSSDTQAMAGLNADVVFDISQTTYDSAGEIVDAIIASGAIPGVTLSDGGNDLIVTASTPGTAGASAVTVSTSVSAGGSGRTLQIGANASQSFTIYFENMDAEALNMASETGGATYTTSDGKLAFYTSIGNVNDDGVDDQFALDVSTAEKASAAISAIDDAMSVVSAQRSKLGGYQNRLEHTIANLGTAAENLTAAESRIRDVDMANEMMEFTKMNILQQAATAMLAQANQQPQNILQLLR